MRIPIRHLLWAVCLCAGAAPVAAQQRLYGLCTASAAVSLGHGYFVVADDDLDVLTIYNGQGAAQLPPVELFDFLNSRTGKKNKFRESDLEGAATIGQRIYWIGSHARKGADGAIDPHRQVLFATDIDNSAAAPMVRPVGRPYTGLIEALLKDGRYTKMIGEAVKYPPETAKGLNIEGLAATGDGALLIGLRGPLENGRAKIIPFTNPGLVFGHNAEPAFGDLIELDLGGRAIRSIERVGDEILIAAGPYAGATPTGPQPAFALFRWSGAAKAAPQFIRSLDHGTFRAEALFFDADKQQLVVLSDDGDETFDGVGCKAKHFPADKKSFRVQRIAWATAAGKQAPAAAGK